MSRSAPDWAPHVELPLLGTLPGPHHCRRGSFVIWCDGPSAMGLFATAPQRASDIANTYAMTMPAIAQSPRRVVLFDATAFGRDADAFETVLRNTPDFAEAFTQRMGRIALVVPSDWSNVWWRGLAALPAWSSSTGSVFTDVGEAYAWLGVSEAAQRGIAALQVRLSSASKLCTALDDRLRDDAGLTLEAAARALACSPRTLQRALADSEQTFLGVRSRVRLALATAALTETDASIDSIAARVGFSSRSHFMRWFSGETGETPSAYRRSHAR